MKVNFKSDYRMMIDGELCDATQSLEVFNPATRGRIAEVPDCSLEQLNNAVVAARKAFPFWRALPQSKRREAVEVVADVIDQNAEELMALLTREQGKPRPDAAWEVGGSALWLREMAKLTLEEEAIEETSQRRVVTHFSPLGVVGAITPWNFPILLAVWKIAPALVTGNCIIVKPSPYTPLCTLKLGELCRKVLPRGVFNVVSGGDALGRWMTEHPDIDKIAFTGHTDTGKHVMRSAAGTLKRLTLELGGTIRRSCCRT